MEYAKKKNVSTAEEHVSLIVILLFLPFLNCIITLRSLYSTFCQLSNSLLNVASYIRRVGSKSCKSKHFTDRNLRNLNKNSNCDFDQELISLGEVTMVMEEIGTCYDPNGDKIKDGLSSNDIIALFEEEEPSLEEIKEAFSLFDENKDGFIDSNELRKVVCKLCCVEATEEKCRKMIRAYDDNGDGVIDFNEFVKLVATSF